MADIVDFPKQPADEPEPLWRSVLGARLRRLRGERGYSLTQTARRAGISPQYLSEIERGLKEPSSEMVAAVAGALDSTLFEVAALAVDDLRRSTVGVRLSRAELRTRTADLRTRRPTGPVALAA